MNARGLIAAAACLALVAWFWSRGEQFLAHNGPTFDEPVHLAAGYSYWTTGSFRLNHEDPPLLKLLWAVPLLLDRPPYPHEIADSTNNDHWHIGTAFLFHSDRSPQELLTPARRVNLAIGCGVVLLVGWWAFRIWHSHLAAVAACCFAVCDPNLLALSCVLTTDAGLTFFTLLACYFQWEYAAKPSRSLLVASGVALGLGLAAKYSAVAVVLGLIVAGVVYVARGGRLALPGTPVESLRSRSAVEFAFRLGLIAFLTLAAAYGFIHFDEWGRGLKFQLTRAEHGDGVMYLNGELSRSGWYHYFLVLLPLKLPLGLLVAAGLTAACLATTRALAFTSPLAGEVAARSAERGGRDESLAKTASLAIPSALAINSPSTGEVKNMGPRAAFLLVPPLVFFALASYSRVNLGVRVVLPVLPFVYLLAAGLACGGCCRIAGRVLLGVCLVWSAVSAVRSDPYPLSYFNELAGGPHGGILFAADSNLDWGQGLPALKKYLDAHGIGAVYLSYFGTDRPETYCIRYQPLPTYGRVGVPGGEAIPINAPRHILVVSVNNLLGIYLDSPDLFAWLRDRKPTAVIAGSLYLFDLTGDSDALGRIQKMSLATGR